MSDLVYEALYQPSDHRHHHPLGGYPTLPVVTASGINPRVQREEPEELTFPANRLGSFLWWDVGGDVVKHAAADPRYVDVTFGSSDEGSCVVWYLPRGDGKPSPQGLTFDAWSEADGDFLDWDVEPFTVTPPESRRDNLAGTTEGPVVVGLDQDTWPGRPDLVFHHWEIAGAPLFSSRTTVSVPQGGSAFAFAIYRSTVHGPPPPPPQFPPQWWRMGDPAFARRVLDQLRNGPLSQPLNGLGVSAEVRAYVAAAAPELSMALAPALDQVDIDILTSALKAATAGWNTPPAAPDAPAPDKAPHPSKE